MYKEARIVISGYYGFNNIGDEAILYVIINTLKEKMPNVKIIVLSNNPELTSKTYNVTCVDRWNLKLVAKTIKTCDILISGGGSLLQDVTSNKTIPYYLLVVKIAQIFKKKTLFFSQGIGPVNNKHNYKLIKAVCNKVDALFVRDIKSKELLLKAGVKRSIQVSLDPVFGIKLNPNTKIEVVENKKVGIYIREWTNTDEIAKSIADSCHHLIKLGYDIYFVSMQYIHDIEIAKLVENIVKHPNVHVLDKPLSIEEVLAYTNSFDFIIGMRLHSLIMAYALGIPMIAISYDPKVENIMKEMNIDNYVYTENISSTQLIQHIDYLTENLFLQKQIIEKTLQSKTTQLEAPLNFLYECLKI